MQWNSGSPNARLSMAFIVLRKQFVKKIKTLKSISFLRRSPLYMLFIQIFTAEVIEFWITGYRIFLTDIVIVSLPIEHS